MTGGGGSERDNDRNKDNFFHTNASFEAEFRPLGLATTFAGIESWRS
jgi:hypothetical protein